jgi:hypothetical protein
MYIYRMVFLTISALTVNLILGSTDPDYTLLQSHPTLDYYFEAGFLEVPAGQTIQRLTQWTINGSNEPCPWTFWFNPLYFLAI